MREAAGVVQSFVLNVVAPTVQRVLKVKSVDAHSLAESIDLLLVHANVRSAARKVGDVRL